LQLLHFLPDTPVVSLLLSRRKISTSIFPAAESERLLWTCLFLPVSPSFLFRRCHLDMYSPLPLPLLRFLSPSHPQEWPVKRSCCQPVLPPATFPTSPPGPL